MGKSNVKKTKPRATQRLLPGIGDGRLFTRLGTASIFQVPGQPTDKQGGEGQDRILDEAVIEQLCLEGELHASTIFLPPDSYLWRKLPVERAEGEG